MKEGISIYIVYRNSLGLVKTSISATKITWLNNINTLICYFRNYLIHFSIWAQQVES